MWLGIISSATMLFLAAPAFADACLFQPRRPFQLSSDTVEWTMLIASGRTCTQGLRLGSINITSVMLIAPPQSGNVDLKGHSSSASRFTAGAAGFLNLSQCRMRPLTYGEPSRFDTMPLQPSLKAWR